MQKDWDEIYATVLGEERENLEDELLAETSQISKETRKEDNETKTKTKKEKKKEIKKIKSKNINPKTCQKKKSLKSRKRLDQVGFFLENFVHRLAASRLVRQCASSIVYRSRK
eukprot:TRINITY_DN9232_c0_g1_i4.p1 TRINITY_DN9232_c0_g1~~TRINITY_DN9232_c0_g1_i4.p1  ORF type:complete len:113 (-),score=18.56 TRINITY_DN9232_c0_g1_i4:122-460(-)